MTPAFHIFRRHLPHWRLEGATYFVTWRLMRGQPVLCGAERTTVLQVICHFRGVRFFLGPHVVMDDHVHVIVRPNSSQTLSSILHSWKSFSAHTLQREHHRAGAVWLDESFDRIIRDEEDLLEKAAYILNNPRKRWPDVEQYAWVGLGHGECGGAAL